MTLYPIFVEQNGQVRTEYFPNKEKQKKAFKTLSESHDQFPRLPTVEELLEIADEMLKRPWLR